jgi:hypothetical protein
MRSMLDGDAVAEAVLPMSSILASVVWSRRVPSDNRGIHFC